MELCVCFRRLYVCSVHTLKNKGASKGSSGDAIEEPFFGSTKNPSVKGSLKNHLFLTFDGSGNVIGMTESHWKTTENYNFPLALLATSTKERSHISCSKNVWGARAQMWQAVNSGAREGEMWGTNTVQDLHSSVLVVI